MVDMMFSDDPEKNGEGKDKSNRSEKKGPNLFKQRFGSKKLDASASDEAEHVGVDFGRFRNHARQEQRTDYVDESIYRRTSHTTININHAEVGGGFFNQYQQQSSHNEQARGYETSRRRLQADVVSKMEADLVYQVYQQPPSYQRAWGQLDSSRIVLLKGAKGIGKRASAIRLTLDVLGTESTIYDVSPDSDLLATLDADSLKPNTGYIVDGLLPHKAKRLTGRQWQRLANRIQQMKCCLVICIPNTIKLPLDVPTGLVCPMVMPTVDSAELVKHHLYHYAAISRSTVEDTEIEACLTDPVLVELFSTTKLPPLRAAQLASSLWGYLNSDHNLEDALAQFRVYDDEAVIDWFENFGLDESQVAWSEQIAIEERALRISLAIFDGLAYDDFRQLNTVLTHQLLRLFNVSDKKLEGEKNEPKARLPFGKHGRNRSALQRAQAELQMMIVPTSFNEHSQLRIVRLRNPRFRWALLRYLWTNDDYAQVFDLIIAWLRHLGGHNIYTYRIFAADAVSEIAKFDFRLVRQQVLMPWIQANHSNQRTAVSRVFGNLVWDYGRDSDIMALLAHWSKARNKLYVWAALRAYSRVGLRHPVQALNQWHYILDRLWLHIEIPLNDQLILVIDGKDKNRPMIQSLIDSMHSLLEQALQWPTLTAQIYGAVLGVLCSWFDEPRSNHSRALAIYLFLVLSGLRQPQKDVEDENELPPALLDMVDTEDVDGVYVQSFATMLNHMLADLSLKAVMMDILEDWLRFVEYDRSYKPPLLTVLQALTELPAAKEREIRRLCVYLRRWSQRSRKRLPVAGELMRELGLRCEALL